MQLNRECMRDVLLRIESDLFLHAQDDGLIATSVIWLNDLANALPEYSIEDVCYSIMMLDEAGYIHATFKKASGGIYSCRINNMTFAGHEFLDRIRDTERWRKVKTVLGAVRDYSLSAIAATAEGITAGAIQAYLSNKP